MNIPLDRLYHYIENIAQEIYGDRVIIYRFWPHGLKNINDLNMLYPVDWYQLTPSPLIWCNDQEPLDYEFYSKQVKNYNDSWTSILKSINLFYAPKNLNYANNIFEKGLLLHSEKRSANLKRYQLDNKLITVYYWSHGVIARDWFRFAEHVVQKKQIQKTFLIYNRAWSGTREYRLQFVNLLVKSNLQNCCRSSINPIEPELGIHYKIYKFKNPVWKPSIVLENFFPINTAPSHYSADFNIEDYEATDIEVVLETLFDDDRLHLTEKSLRPIACGQPFILAGTHGSLEYLRSYGFKTFGHIWDERYDLIEDPEERLIRITDLMKQITNWTPEQRANKLAQAQAIADYNRRHFFSKEFFDLIINELNRNLKLAFNELELCNNYQPWITRWQKLMTYPEVVEFLNTNQDLNLPTKESVKFVIKVAQARLAKIASKNKN
jgi:hypothetical protein